MIIEFGVLSPPLKEQLGDSVKDDPALPLLQMDADSINRLYVRGLLTGSETKKARERLAKKLSALLKRA